MKLENLASTLALVAILAANYAWARSHFEATSSATQNEAERDVLRLPSHATMRVAFAGFETLAADVAWIACAVHYGRIQPSDSAPHVEANARLVADLDPHFRDVYTWYTGFYSQMHNPMSVRQVESVNGFLDRGRRYFPNDFWLPYHAGMNYIGSVDYDGPGEKRRGYERAIEYLEAAARQDGAPSWVPLTVASLHERRLQLSRDTGEDSESLENSRRRHVAFLSEMYYVVDDRSTRRSIRRELRETEVGRRALEQLERKYASRLRTEHAASFSYLPVPVWSFVAPLQR